MLYTLKFKVEDTLFPVRSGSFVFFSGKAGFISWQLGALFKRSLSCGVLQVRTFWSLVQYVIKNECLYLVGCLFKAVGFLWYTWNANPDLVRLALIYRSVRGLSRKTLNNFFRIHYLNLGPYRSLYSNECVSVNTHPICGTKHADILLCKVSELRISWITCHVSELWLQPSYDCVDYTLLL